MTIETVSRLKCDRCGHKAETDDKTGWAKIAARESGGDRGIGGTAQLSHHDLCPGCLDAFLTFYASASAPMDQPAPREVEPSRDIRVKVGLRERKAISTIIGKVLDGVFDRTIGIVREQPAAFLTGEQAINPGQWIGMMSDQLVGDVVGVVEAIRIKG